MMDNDLLLSMQGKLQNQTTPSTQPSPVSTSIYLGFPLELQGAFSSGQAMFNDLSGDRFPSGLAIFPRSNRIIVNEYGVFIPQSVLGKDVVVATETQPLPKEGIRVIVSAQSRHSQREIARSVDVIDCSREMQWLKEHRHKYIGEWVALDGDRLLAHGPNAHEIYDKARALGVPVPSVLRIEASDELPFGGW
jgi:uncharacterized protein DUF5678